MARTQREWTEMVIGNMGGQAKLAGLLPLDATLHYSKGSPMNGVAPSITGYDAEGKRLDPQPRFIPQFNIKDSARTVERVCGAVERTLYEVNENK